MPTCSEFQGRSSESAPSDSIEGSNNVNNWSISSVGGNVQLMSIELNSSSASRRSVVDSWKSIAGGEEKVNVDVDVGEGAIGWRISCSQASI